MEYIPLIVDSPIRRTDLPHFPELRELLSKDVPLPHGHADLPERSSRPIEVIRLNRECGSSRAANPVHPQPECGEEVLQ